LRCPPRLCAFECLRRRRPGALVGGALRHGAGGKNLRETSLKVEHGRSGTSNLLFVRIDLLVVAHLHGLGREGQETVAKGRQLWELREGEIEQRLQVVSEGVAQVQAGEGRLQ